MAKASGGQPGGQSGGQPSGGKKPGGPLGPGGAKKKVVKKVVKKVKKKVAKKKVGKKAAGKKSSIMSWAKENPTKAKIAGVVAVLVITGVVIVRVMFSGDEGDGSSRERSSRPAGKTRATQATKTGAQTTEKTTAATKTSDVRTPPPDGPTTPDPVVERSGDLATWTDQNLLDARLEGDKRLVDAIELRVDQPPGSDETAELIAQMLPPPAEEEPDGTPGTRTKRPAKLSRDAIETLVAAFGDLSGGGSAKARGFLEQLLAGTLLTDDDKVALETALNALVDSQTAENEEILFRAMTAAEQFRPAGQEGLTAAELRELALEAVEADASEAFRIKLAQFLIAPTTAATLKTTIGPFLETKHPDNLAAQLIFYQDEKWIATSKATLEQFFTEFSADVMRRTLGITDEATSSTRRPTRPGGSRTPKPEPTEEDLDLPYRMARTLWSPASATLFAGKLAEVDSFEEQVELLNLGSTMPLDATRFAVYGALDRNFDQGPEKVPPAHQPDSLVTDPGFLMVLKAVARKKATSRPTASEDRERFVKAQEDWKKAVQDSVRTWCDRLNATAEAQLEAAKLAGQPPTLDPAVLEPWVKLPADAKLTQLYHLDWPGTAAEKLTGVEPGAMKIRYARIEEEARLKIREGYFKRQLFVRDSETLDKSIWLNNVRIGSTPEQAVSLDVLITRPDGDATADEAEDVAEELVIEILWIELKNPTKSGA